VVRRRLDVKQAAQVLDISTDAVHKRVRRGALESEKDGDGRVYVWLDGLDNGYALDSQNVQPLLVTHLENENEFLRCELERRAEELSEMRRIVAALVQRVPELEPTKGASPEPRESPTTDAEPAGSGAGPAEPERRSWWRRWFGG
jgi:hypothetical protein